MRMQVRFLALLSGLRIQHCLELGCRSRTQPGSGVAVAVVQAGSCSSDSTPSLGTSICLGCGPKKQKQTHTQTKKTGFGRFNNDMLLALFTHYLRNVLWKFPEGTYVMMS